MKAIVTGMIATYPVGGVVWDYAQYIIGLHELGFEVYYLEDTGSPTYNPIAGLYGDDRAYSLEFLSLSLESMLPGMGGRWHFRAMDDRTYGLSAKDFGDILAESDLFLNISGGTLMRPEYMHSRRKALVDSDPGLNHFVNYPKWDKNPGWLGTKGFRAHDFFFTYAERIGKSDCPLPSFDLPWIPTRPPVASGKWSSLPPGDIWTTVMTWDNFRKPIQHGEQSYGSKELEFPRIERIPSRVHAPVELAIGGNHAPREHWKSLGWSVVESHAVSATTHDYHRYVCSSRGEFSVAKNIYVATRCGWFSCRSVCYLAAGRPVVIQDTGFSEIIPCGDGVLPFTSLETAAGAINRVEGNYAAHQSAARAIALEYFDCRKVIPEMLGHIGLN